MEDALYFVIDTDTYAGNFEREMCAYVTGVIGDCGVGDTIVEKLDGNKDIEEIGQFISIEADEHGCWRPCKIYPTPGWANNGMGYCYKIGDNQKALEEYAKACRQQAEEMLKVYAHMPEHAKEQHDEWMKKASGERLSRDYPAYLSIAIVLESMPPDNVIALMKERAKQFEAIAQASNSKQIGARFDVGEFNITGFRLVTETVMVSDKAL